MWKPSEVTLAPMNRARMLAPRALACSSVSITISAPASPNTNPLRSLSNGRQAPAGSSLLVDNTMRIWANPAIGTASILVSTPPQIAMSASPSAICCQARAMASEPEAHAEIEVITPALALPLQTDRGSCGVGHVHLHGQRGDRPQARCSHAVVGEDQLLAGAHAGADGHQQPVGIHLGRTRVLPDPPAQHGGHLLQVAHPAVLDPVQLAVEFLEQMPTDADWQVELLDERVLERTDAALPVQQQLPRGLRVGCQGGRHGDAGDNDVGETVPRSQL